MLPPRVVHRYGVPGTEAEAFEQVMVEAVPELMQSEKGLLYKMVTMLPPETALKAGVRVCHLLQRPGSFVITWPRAYHAGFSHGLNCAESSNFATPDWLPWGRASIEAYRNTERARKPCFTHEMLLLSLAGKATSTSAHISVWVEGELRQLIEAEQQALDELSALGVSHLVPSGGGGSGDGGGTQAAPAADGGAASGDGGAAEADGDAASGDGGASADGEGGGGDGMEVEPPPPPVCPVCSVCDYECYLSSVEHVAPDGSARALCAMHALERLRGGAAASAFPCVRVYRSVPALRAQLAVVQARAADAAAWIARVRTLLDPAAGDARATLPEMQAALQAGEKLRMEDEHFLRAKLCVQGASAAAAKAQALLTSTTRAKRVAQPTLAQCDEALKEAAEWPLIIPPAEELRTLASQGRDWTERAAAALAASPRALEPLEQLLAEATQIPLTLPEKDECAAAAAALRWQAQCAELAGDAEAGPPTVQAVRALAAAGAKLGGALPPEQRRTLSELTRRAERAEQWAEAATACMKRATSLEQLRGAVARAAELDVQLPALKGLRERLALCEGWLQRAEGARSDADAARIPISGSNPGLTVMNGGSAPLLRPLGPYRDRRSAARGEAAAQGGGGGRGGGAPERGARGARRVALGRGRPLPQAGQRARAARDAHRRGARRGVAPHRRREQGVLRVLHARRGARGRRRRRRGRLGRMRRLRRVVPRAVRTRARGAGGGPHPSRT